MNDPISNRGLKMLFSLDLQALRYLGLDNLNYTQDIMKTLNKLNSKRGLLDLIIGQFPNFVNLFMNVKDLFSECSD